MKIIFADQGWDDFTYWVDHDRKIAKRIIRLIKEIEREPFEGIGKPEPLKHLGPDIWSRRITSRDRLVYRVGDDFVDFLQARYHY